MTEPTAAAATPDDVRAAAEALKAAIDRHLAAVEARTGEDDPVVQEAYDAVRTAAEAYDDALFDVYDEVTPFDLVEQPGEGEAVAEAADDLDADPETLTVLLRRDYDVVDLDTLVAAGHSARVESDGAAAEDEAAGEEEHVGAAVYHLVHAYGVDGLHARAEDIGLEPTGGTMWLLDEVPGDIDDDAFEGVDEERVRLRLDEVYAVDPPL